MVDFFTLPAGATTCSQKKPKRGLGNKGRAHGEHEGQLGKRDKRGKGELVDSKHFPQSQTHSRGVNKQGQQNVNILYTKKTDLFYTTQIVK